MTIRRVLGACLAAAFLASGGWPSGPATAYAAAAQQPSPPASSPQPVAATDDDVTIKAFLLRLEEVVRSGNAQAFVALEGPLGNDADAQAFANAEMRPGATRVVVQERDRAEATLAGIPGGGYSITVDAFIEYGNQARVATWQFYVRKLGDSWGIVRQTIVSTVDNLFRLNLNTAVQYDVNNLVLRAEDLEMTVAEGTVFTIETDSGITGLVLMGRGEMRFSPAPDTEKGQVRIFSGAETLVTPFDAAYVRVGAPRAHFDRALLVPRTAVDPRDLRRAQQIFREESSKSFAVDLADLTRESWTLLPAYDDFLAEIRTRRFSTLTYARSAAEPEDVSLFERKRKRSIALYASKEKLQNRGRFYNEDDLASFDVLDYDIDVTSLPERAWIEGRARMRIKVRTSSLGQLTLKLADSLVVRSISSDAFGRMFNLRVTNQNTVLVNLPTLLVQDAEMLLTVTYGGRLEPQSPDRETIGVGQGTDPPTFDTVPGDITSPRAEPTYLYSNRSYWYPQSSVTDYATATIRLTIPSRFGCVATGELTGPPQALTDGATEPRKACVFRAARPVRYLSFIVSRFATADRDAVLFNADGSGKGGAPAVDAPDALPSLDLTIAANPRQTGRGRELTPRAADIIRFYQSVVGDSPYPSFTLAVVDSLLPGGHSPPYWAQLNQPLPYSPFVWRNDPAAFENYPEFFMAHEIAHQWWGHGVGWQNYHEQWISEGFAQYFAALYARHFRGEETFDGILRRMRKWAIDESAQGPVHLGYRVGHIRNDGRAFRAIVYNKGAMVLHMMRQLVGDEVFFRGIQRFYLGSRFRKVGSEDFRVAMEMESGRSLQRFFERWVYSAEVPQVRFTWRTEPADGGQTTAVLRFEQAGSVFDLPVTVTLDYADGRSEDVVVPVTDAVVETPVPLRGPLRGASISRRDSALAIYR
jgi:hypothetical protein